MKSLLTIALFTLAFNASAIELQAYKDASTNVVTLSDSAVEKVWADKSPACMKDGSKIIGVNSTFKALGLGYRDCSNGVAAVRKHKALGYHVTVIKLAELSDNMIRQVLKK